MSIRTTDELLTEWGHWSRRGGTVIPRYVSPATAIYLRNIEQPHTSDPAITDDEAMQVDGAVARLCKRDDEMGSVLLLRFLYGWSIRQVAGKLDLDRRRVDVLLNSGVAWVDAVLEVGRGQTGNVRKIAGR